MQFKKKNQEILIATGKIVKLKPNFIQTLKTKASANIRKRIRICTHKNTKNLIHEMFIVHMKGNYIRPHKHLNKNESLHIIEGRADVVFFDEKGDIDEIITIGDYLSKDTFYFRIEKPIYHTIIVNTRYLIFHEVTKGPFSNSDTVFAPWSPNEKDSLGVKIFHKALSQKIKNISTQKKQNEK